MGLSVIKYIYFFPLLDTYETVIDEKINLKIRKKHFDLYYYNTKYLLGIGTDSLSFQGGQ